MKKSFLAVLAFVAIPSFAMGQSSAKLPEPNGYFQSAGFLTGQLETIVWIEEFCSEAFPATRMKNKDALAQWREKYADIVAEVERQPDLINQYHFNLPKSEQPSASIYAQLAAHSANEKIRRKNQLLAVGAARFQQTCNSYPQVLHSDSKDLERRYAKEVAAMRQGPKPYQRNQPEPGVKQALPPPATP